MDRTTIGFKVMTDKGIRTIELDQDEFNSKIMKDSIVEIIDQNISGQDFTDIELYAGDDYE